MNTRGDGSGASRYSHACFAAAGVSSTRLADQIRSSSGSTAWGSAGSTRYFGLSFTPASPPHRCGSRVDRRRLVGLAAADLADPDPVVVPALEPPLLVGRAEVVAAGARALAGQHQDRGGLVAELVRDLPAVAFVRRRQPDDLEADHAVVLRGRDRLPPARRAALPDHVAGRG